MVLIRILTVYNVCFIVGEFLHQRLFYSRCNTLQCMHVCKKFICTGILGIIP